MLNGTGTDLNTTLDEVFTANGTAKLKNDPGLCDLTKTALKGFLTQKYKDDHKDEDRSELDQDISAGKKAAEVSCNYVDWLLSTVNPNPPDYGVWIRLDCHPCQNATKTFQTVICMMIIVIC